MESKLKAYKEAWISLQQELEKGKTSWGKIELKQLMDKILINSLEKQLESKDV